MSLANSGATATRQWVNESVNSALQSLPAESNLSSWELIAFDDFNGTAVDSTLWTDPYEGVGNDGVGTRDPSTVSVSNGAMHITAHSAVATPSPNGVGGGIESKVGQLYGRWEVRARMQAGNGYGPAILLMPTTDAWPPELDLVEMPSGDRQTIHITTHYNEDNEQDEATVSVDGTQWHTYAVEWLPTSITYYIDGVVRKTITASEEIPTVRMDIRLQVDIGGNGYIQVADATTPATCALDVDYLKVWTRNFGAPTITVSTIAPTSPKYGDIWIDIS